VLSAVSLPAHAQGRPYIYGCGMVWGHWLGYGQGETAKEWDRRSFDKIAQMGGTNAPANFAWIGIEPTQGTYDWSYVDHQVAEATARGLEIFAYSGLTPDWALPPGILDQYGSGIGYRFPPDEQYIPDFENFFRTLAARYRGQVKYYEFWNEPNGCSWINDNCSNGHMAETYVPWLIRWYDAMKQGDPDCVLAVGGLDYNEGVTQGYEYIEDIYTYGGGDHFDAVAIHPYASSGLHWQAITDTYQVLVNHGDGHKKLWLNEYGWNTSDENFKAQQITNVLTELKKPEYHMVFQANHLVISDLPGTPDWGHDYGLCSRNTTTLELFPRQSWYAFQALDKVFPQTIQFSADQTTGTAPRTVQFTDESTASGITAWLWDFGDGQTSTTSDPQHTYAAEGIYTVKLTITAGGLDEMLEKQDYIRVGDFPKVGFIGGQMPPTLSDSYVIAHLQAQGLQVTSYDDEPANRPTASQIAAEHDMVIGSSTILSANVAGEFRNESVPFLFWESSLAWNTPQPREAIAEGPTAVNGHTKINVIDNSHPVMNGIPLGLVTVTTGGENFSYCTGSVAPGARVLATAEVLPSQKTMIVVEPGDTLLDGGVAAGKRAILFLYDTTWTLTNSTGKKIFDNTVQWMLGTPSPDISADQTSGVAPLTVQFLDTSTGPVTGWTWDFGDGEPSRLRHPTHTFDTPGLYDVTLTVNGPGGPVAVTLPDYVSVQIGPTYLASDFDQDDDVDLDDYAVMQTCLWVLNPAGACAGADLDNDTFVDEQDLAVFLGCLSGPGVPADVNCEN
jgi:PKD repeat protein